MESRAIGSPWLGQVGLRPQALCAPPEPKVFTDAARETGCPGASRSEQGTGARRRTCQVTERNGRAPQGWGQWTQGREGKEEKAVRKPARIPRNGLSRVLGPGPWGGRFLRETHKGLDQDGSHWPHRATSARCSHPALETSAPALAHIHHPRKFHQTPLVKTLTQENGKHPVKTGPRHRGLLVLPPTPPEPASSGSRASLTHGRPRGAVGTQGPVGQCGGHPGCCGIPGSHPLNARTHPPTCDNHEVVTR